MTKQELKRTIRGFIRDGIYCQHEIFNRIYPTYTRHYSTLRDTIAEVKNGHLS